MKKRTLSTLAFLMFLLGFLNMNAQFESEIESINSLLEKSKDLIYEDTNESLKFAIDARKKYKHSYGEKLLAEIEYRTGAVYYVSSVYDKALEHFLNASSLYENLNDTYGVARSNTGLGLVEMGIENYQSSIDYYRKAEKFLNNKNDKMQCVIDFNLGLNYLFLEKWDTGLKYLWKSSKKAPLHNRFDIQQMAYINLGDYYLKLKNYDSAYIYYQKVDKHPETVNSWQKTQLYRGLAQYYLTQNDINEAENFANEALKLAKKSNSKWEISSNLSTLAEIAYKKELFEEAFLLKKQETAYNDTLSSEKTINKIKYIIHKEKEAELHELSHKHEEAESNLASAIWAIAITLFLLVASLLLLSLFSKRLKTKNISNKFLDEKNNDLKESLATKTKILSIISHDMKSPLAAIKQILMMYNDGMLEREEQDMLLKKLLIQVETTIEMLNNLVFWAKKQANGIKMNKIAINPLDTIKSTISYNKIVLELKEIQITLDSDGFEKTKTIIDPDQFQIICQNILGNSIKYSHNGGKIDISFSEQNKMIHIHFIDYGIGMDHLKIEEIQKKGIEIKSQSGTNDEKGSGLGLVLVQSLLELNEGYLTIKSKPNQGSEFIVSLKKAI